MTSNARDLDDLIGRHVTIFWGPDRERVGPPAASGRVIGIYDHPTLIVEAEDGTQVIRSSHLPRTVDADPDTLSAGDLELGLALVTYDQPGTWTGIPFEDDDQ